MNPEIPGQEWEQRVYGIYEASICFLLGACQHMKEDYQKCYTHLETRAIEVDTNPRGGGVLSFFVDT